jgi:hypothetical protein
MPRRKSPSPEEVLSAYRSLTHEDQVAFCRALFAEAGARRRLLELLVLDLRAADLWDDLLFGMVRVFANAFLEAEQTIAHRVPKPRNTARDAEIVRLRDEQRLTFQRIGRKLQEMNSRWVGEDGEPLDHRAVRKAYYRHKSRPAD